MQRITISVEDSLAEDFQRLLEERHYKNRSEAFRDLVRHELAQRAIGSGTGEAVALVSYVYNHHSRQLSERMIEHQHSNGDLVVSALHVHVDPENCLEAVILRGKTDTIRDFANALIAETGVEHGQIHLISRELSHEEYSHSKSYPHGHSHGHAHPHMHGRSSN